jgi:hypothetical protein
VGAAIEAAVQVRAQQLKLVGRRVAGDERSEQWRQLGALNSGLDRGEPPGECPSAFGQAAIHLGVRPARELADLAVGVALRLKLQRSDLVGLELRERLGSLPQTLVLLGSVGGDLRCGWPIHTAAMNLLTAGVDASTIALWLGHEQERTTHIDLHADLELKQRTLERITPPEGRPGRYRAPDTLLAFLEGL